MVYYPYFRGKQFELIAIRETAGLMAKHKFVPIISPVNKQFGGLGRTLDVLRDSNVRSIVIINPEHGQLNDNPSDLRDFLIENYSDYVKLILGIRLDANTSTAKVLELINKVNGRPFALIHDGFKDPKQLLAELESEDYAPKLHVFIENNCGILYQKNFKNSGDGVLICDGFTHRRNRDLPPLELFSDKHVTYNMGYLNGSIKGFGDFLIVGDEYSETGGPAYTVAIHLTFIDPDQDNVMFINHFLSDSRDSAANPGGKFKEALSYLLAEVSKNDKIIETSGVKEFRKFHEFNHYPGLGKAKKSSMIHHIETMADFVEKQKENI